MESRQMTDTIALHGLRVRGFHGVLPEERAVGQLFVADVILEVDTAAAAASDDLDLTVDYSVVAHQLADIIGGEPVSLIETLAQRLADVCLTHALVDAVEVTVHKPDAPVGLPVSDLLVRIRRERRR
jgi:dihydroneopterin aldolase